MLCWPRSRGRGGGAAATALLAFAGRATLNETAGARAARPLGPESFFELIERSADFELIIEAARELTPEKVKSALDAGADLEGRDERGWTPLMLAIERNENPEIVQALLHAGADATAKDNHGSTAWDLIQANEALRGTNVYRRLNELQSE